MVKVSRQTGFTIIELMIVVVIVTIVATLAVPAFDTFIKANRMRASEGELVTAFQFARAEAVRRGSTVNLDATGSNASNEWGSGLTVWFDADDDDTLDNGEELRVLGSFHSSMTLDGTNGITSIGFRPTGLTDMAGTLTITVCDDRVGETGRQLSILTTGVVSANSTFTCP